MKKSKNINNIFKYWVLALILNSLFLIPVVQAAELYFIPNAIDTYISDSLTLELRVDSEEKVNAIDSYIYWPVDMLALEVVQTGGSVFNLWISGQQPEEEGRLHIQAGSTQGFTGTNGLVAYLIFQVKDRLGQAQINFAQETKLLTADGQATPVELELADSQVDIKTLSSNIPQLISSRQPDEFEWYSNNFIDVSWEGKSGYQYSYLLSRDQTISPDEEPEIDPLYNIKYEGLADGLYYFHLLVKPDGEEWLPKVTRRFMIDTTSPGDFFIILSQDPSVSDRKLLVFTAQDDTSGIDHYELLMPNGEWERVVSPHPIDLLKWGDNLHMRAIDLAGNTTEKSLSLHPSVRSETPLVEVITGATVVIILAVGAVVLLARKSLFNI